MGFNSGFKGLKNCGRDLVNGNRHTVYCIDVLYNKKEYNLMMADIEWPKNVVIDSYVNHP